MPTPPDHALKTTLAGIDLACPILLAAGTAGYLDETADVLDLSRIGAVITKSITRRPREGNATWRIIDARAGMLNAIGLANVGLDHFIEHIAPRIPEVPTRVIASIAGFSIDDYVQTAAAMDEVPRLAGVELNVSCPNVHGGTEFGADPGALRELIAAVRPVLSRLPMLVKLSPIVGPAPGGEPLIVQIARAAVGGGTQARRHGGTQGADTESTPDHDQAGRATDRGSARSVLPAAPNNPTPLRPGADALSIGNTIPAMAIDVNSRRPRLANTTGGLSGPALHPITLKLVHDVYHAVARDAGIPIVGVGGILRWQDAAEFILAGAAAVQIGTGLFVDPRIPQRVAQGLQRWTRTQGAQNISELVGAMRTEEG